MARPDSGALDIESPEIDRFILEVRGFQREPQSEFTFLANFVYPKGSLGESTALPTTVPSTAVAEIYPNVDFPVTLGEPGFVGTVETRIESVTVPEITPRLSLLALGAWGVVSQLKKQRKQ